MKTSKRFDLRGSNLSIVERPELFGGTTVLVGDADVVDAAEFTTLYRNSPPQAAPAQLTALPYFLWSNRGQGSMLVWIPEK